MVGGVTITTMAPKEPRPIRSASPQIGLDPEVVFKVEGVIFGIPRSQLLVSEFFRDMLNSEHIGSPDEGTKENPIILNAVSLSQVTSFYKVINSRRFDPRPNLSLKQWSEALDLATSWGFEHLRTYIIQILDLLAQDPLDRIQIADECGLTEWLHPAYAKLCARDAPLTAEEGRRLGFERFAAIGWIRETELKERHRLAVRGPSLAPSPTGPPVLFFGGAITGPPSRSATPVTPLTFLQRCNKDCCRPPFELDSTEKGFVSWVAEAEALNTHIPSVTPLLPPITPEAGEI